MKAYKGLLNDMSTLFGDRTYEIGVLYHTEGKLELDVNGFHACKNISDVFAYHPYGARIFEVELGGVMIEGIEIPDGDQYCAETMIITKELLYEDLTHDSQFMSQFNTREFIKIRPQLINILDLSELGKYDIVNILQYQPQLINHFDLSILTSRNISNILQHQPQLINHFKKEKP